MVTALKSYPPRRRPSVDCKTQTTKGKNTTLKAFARLQQDHIKAGQPFNFGKWLASVSGDSSTASESTLSHSLLMSGYLCGDFAIQSLCKNFPEGVAQLEELDLGTNSLSDSSVTTLASTLGQSLCYLSLATNSIGSAACDSICNFL